jgi:hypothetical protein
MPPSTVPSAADYEGQIRELRIRVGLLQSELEQLRREHAALRSGIVHDVAALARRYLEPAKHVATHVRNVDGVIFGGWDRPDEPKVDTGTPKADTGIPPPRDTRSA